LPSLDPRTDWIITYYKSELFLKLLEKMFNIQKNFAQLNKANICKKTVVKS